MCESNILSTSKTELYSNMKESGMNEKEAMHMMIMTQCLVLHTVSVYLCLSLPLSTPASSPWLWRYLDTLKEFAGSHGSIVVPHGPSAVGDLSSQIREGFLTAAGQQQMKGGLFG